jgi:hypothetical protein
MLRMPLRRPVMRFKLGCILAFLVALKLIPIPLGTLFYYVLQ